jgi:hypothetical protein
MHFVLLSGYIIHSPVGQSSLPSMFIAREGVPA